MYLSLNAARSKTVTITTPEVPVGAAIDVVLDELKCDSMKSSERTASPIIAATLSCLLRWSEIREDVRPYGGSWPPRGGSANCMASDQFAPSDKILQRWWEIIQAGMVLLRTVHRLSQMSRNTCAGLGSGRLWTSLDDMNVQISCVLRMLYKFDNIWGLFSNNSQIRYVYWSHLIAMHVECCRNLNYIYCYATAVYESTDRYISGMR